MRAYGLNILRTMVLCKDQVAEEKLDLILTIFLEQLEDTDRWASMTHANYQQLHLPKFGQRPERINRCPSQAIST